MMGGDTSGLRAPLSRQFPTRQKQPLTRRCRWVQPRRNRMRGTTRVTPGDEAETETATLQPAELTSGDETLPIARCLELHRVMVRTRVMEERCIKMSKSGE